ncbi:MAG: anaerobic ribonucleoside-triphosphate reductase [Clostridia bacterium]|nr:anaerobic ribonucleoside-triphosphate reductase [Clostridia bacterium]
MFAQIQKRDGRIVDFDATKITEAIFFAAKAVGGDDRETAKQLTLKVLDYLQEAHGDSLFTVEDVQDVVEKILIENGHARTAKAYILYRDRRTRMREARADLMDAVEEILKETNRENANVSNSPSAKMLQIASAASKQYYLSRLIPEEFSYAHRNGDIHIHDLDFYGKTLTCLQIPLGELLGNGFNNGHGFIRPPKRPASAAALSAIILQSCQNDMHGGQSFAVFDRDMGPYVENASEDETYQAMEALVYNLNSMHSRAGSQVPFSSINLGTNTSEGGRKVTRNLLLAYESGLGRGENPVFPNIIFRIKEGVNWQQGDPNYDLLLLAMRVAAKRMNPTFSFMDSSFNKQYGDETSYMGCRTRVMANVRGPEVAEKRGNLSFTTINLPRLAIKAKGNIDQFFNDLDRMMDLAKRQLYHRFGVQSKLRAKDMPFLMGQRLYLDSQDLDYNDPIGKAIVHGTLSMGFIGLAETLKMLVGKHHGEDDGAQELGQEIIRHMRKRIDEAVDEYELNFTLLATPAEGLSGRFVAMDREEFGEIEGVTDKEYYTNSFHLPVGYPIGSFEKISIEGPYHKYTNAGHISYVELSSPPKNNSIAVYDILKCMKESDMGYGGINFPIDYCNTCSYLGIIPKDNCPACGGQDISRIRRITGYLSTVERFNDAKISELNDRVKHV